MYHELIPEVKAGAIVGAMPEVVTGVTVRVTFKAALWVDN